MRAISSAGYYTVYYPDDEEEESGLPAASLRPAPGAAAPEAAASGSASVLGSAQEPELVEVPRSVYFDDVVLQLATKRFEAAFNARDPPKKVQMIYCHCIEFVDEATGQGSGEVMAVERFIEGNYVKHNSNAGYVELHHRATPQCFSHYSFAASGGVEMVVDVQGVGDLYTDPQVALDLAPAVPC